MVIAMNGRVNDELRSRVGRVAASSKISSEIKSVLRRVEHCHYHMAMSHNQQPQFLASVIFQNVVINTTMSDRRLGVLLIKALVCVMVAISHPLSIPTLALNNPLFNCIVS